MSRKRKELDIFGCGSYKARSEVLDPQSTWRCIYGSSMHKIMDNFYTISREASRLNQARIVVSEVWSRKAKISGKESMKSYTGLNSALIAIVPWGYSCTMGDGGKLGGVIAGLGSCCGKLCL